jgi:hypothetical protein
MKRMVLASVLVLAFAVASRAQDQAVSLVFDNGLVTLTADNALKSDVLSEWERLGGTTIRGLERLPAERITIKLAGAHERTALDAVLGPSGYVSTLRKNLPAEQSWLQVIIIAPRSGAAAPAVQRQIDMSIPESRFAFPGASEEELEYVRAVLEATPPPPTNPEKVQDLPMPEVRFHFPGPPLEPETETEPESKPQAKPKKPSGHY